VYKPVRRALGDTTGNGKVNLPDVFKVALAYGSFPGYSTWNPDLGINNDGKINLIDYFITALHYGQVDPSCHAHCLFSPGTRRGMILL